MSQLIPIPLFAGAPAPSFDMQASLENVTYTLRFRWNTRASAWYLDVLDEAGQVVIRGGIKLVANWPLNAYDAGRQPPGSFVAVDSSGANQDPQLSDLGVRVKLLYFTAADLGL